MLTEAKKLEISIAVFQQSYPRYLSFFSPFFPTEDFAIWFIHACEFNHDVSIKRAMHQLVRTISMADNAYKLDENTKLGGIQVQYWIMAIEALYKTVNQKKIKTKSAIIRDFFTNYISTEHQEKLIQAIWTSEEKPLSILEIANLFNGIRNMVAHEGIYWMCRFPDDENLGYILNPKQEEALKNSTYHIGDNPGLDKNMMFYVLQLTDKQIRDIIVSGGIRYILRLISPAPS
ncbi:hypothetical protein [Paenibacillus sp. MMO-177]|uniref:hypothetical protein n=1 Tax=Paenibacillus sp. MMO-177 TaxID=3081289 RepID=UPI003016D884